MMNRNHITMLAASVFLAAMAFSCDKNVEEEAPEARPAGKLTSIEAYIVQPQDPEATKTDYTIDETNKVAVFQWVDGDHIDAVVTKGTTVSSVVFTKQTDDSEHTNWFLDGKVEGQPTLAQRSGYALGDLAFYPSRVSPEAQAGGFVADWSYEGGKYYLDLPASIALPSSKPLSIVPMVGKKDADEKYAFTQPVGVLAVKVENLPLEADFISIHSDQYALAGSFELSENGGVYSIAARAAASDVEKTLTQHFSGISGEYTFYFSLPVGENVYNGLVLTVGSSSDEDLRMTKTIGKAINVPRGTIVRAPKLTFTPVDPQWAAYGTATFKDDFLWKNNSAFESLTSVTVTLERSGLNPKKYRINNPYTVASGQVSYTQTNPDPYFVFLIADDGTISYPDFKTGVKDSNGYPMKLVMSGSSRVVSSQTSGDFYELVFSSRYSLYTPDAGPSNEYWTRDDVIHLTVNVPETWNSLGNCTFIDNFIWPYENLTDPVERDIQQSSINSNRFRIAKPYPAADADEWFEFDASNPNAVTSVNYYTGTTVNDDSSTEVTWKAVVWNGYYNFNYSNVISTQPNGLPLKVQIGPCYRSSKYLTEAWDYDYSQEVGRDNAAYAPNILIVFPHTEETWTSLGKGRYMDEWFWKNNSFAPYNVEVEIWRSDLDPNRYRVANPYTVANKAFKRTAIAGADEYLFLKVDPSTGLVTYETLKTGMDWSNSAGRNLAAAHPAVWNALKGTNLDVSTTKVASGTAAAPLEIQLAGVYYDSADNTHFYTNSTGFKHLWFPDFFAQESWTDFCVGTYKDNIYDTKINGTSTLGTVDIVIQQSSLNAKRYRFANPYKSLDESLKLGNPDDYMFFQYDNGLVYFEPLETGVQMDNSSSILMLSHPVDANLNDGYKGSGNDFSGSSVLTWNSAGTPKKIQLGANWYDKNDPTSTHCYTRGGSAWSENDRIIISFTEGDIAKVTPYEFALKSEFHNPVASLSLPNGTLDKLVVKIYGDLSAVTGLRLYQAGWMDNGYVAPDSEGVVTMTQFTQSVSGGIDLNFWFTGSAVGASYRFEVLEAVVDGVSLPIVQDKDVAHIGGIIVNTGGDAEIIRGSSLTVTGFRIPALVTSNAGTLIGAYDVRYDGYGDLQGDIDVGVKRSTDGGKTWSPLIIAMDMGITGYEAEVAAGTMTEKQARLNNGIGDPCLLVDENTGRLFCFAVWTHGHYNDPDRRSLAWAAKGFEIDETPQFMMVYSDDDGITWSAPVNITRQIKKYDWRMTFQGPGRGITMKDGTLVIPIQHQEGTQKNMHNLYPLNSGIAYSTDHGETWHAHNFAHTITSESAVAEIEPGVLLLTMRDETDSHYRRNYYTTDLGRTWTEHASNGKLLDSTCEASILHVDANKNILGKDLVLFSNPHNTSRSRMTIQASEDKGVTWSHSLLIDSGGSLGYSCLTMIDPATVGILYESSRGDIFFQAIPLTDIVK